MNGTSVGGEWGWMDVCMCVNACSNLDPSIPVGDDPGTRISYSSTTLAFDFKTCCTALGNFTYTIHVGSPCSDNTGIRISCFYSQCMHQVTCVR